MSCSSGADGVIDLTLDSSSDIIEVLSDSGDENESSPKRPRLQCSVKEETDSSIAYYHGNMNLPVYDYPKHGYSVDRLVEILLTPAFDEAMLCKTHPVAVQNNVAFVIDLNCLSNPKDVRADDLGVWKCTGSRSLPFSVKMGSNSCKIVYKCNSTKTVKVHVRRQYHVHGTDPDFHRMIAFVESSQGAVSLPSRCVVQYWFESGREHSIEVKPHGNSKRRTQSFYRTAPSTLEALKEEAIELSPKAAVNVVYEKGGGIMNAPSVGALPRNREQAANIRRGNCNSIVSNKGAHDPLFMVMEQSKSCETGDKFVRVVTGCPEPMCVLATDQQLDDLVRFSTNKNRFCVLSIDPTFSLGDFNVTCIAYRNLLVTDSRTGQFPILLGPILVHQRKLFETYHFFASTLIELRPALAEVLVFGTDGEEALVKAFKQQWHHAVHLRCFRHMKQDIKRKLSHDMCFPESVVTEIISQLFGAKSGPIFHEGLVDSRSEAEFDKKFEALEEQWEKFEFLREKIAGKQLSFHAWFKKYHLCEFKQNMLYSVRVAAGLGDPPSEFCTNDSEAINSSLKQFLGFKKSDWPVFNIKMKKFVHDQQEETFKALVGCGQYKIRDEYRHFMVSPSRWFTSLSDKQKEDARKKFRSCSVDDCQGPSNFTSTDQEYNLASAKLSVSIEKAVEITGLPALVVRQIWAKSADILSSGDRILPAPGSSSSSRMVASTSQKKPHYVSRSSDGRYECDQDCPNFVQRYICSHSVAAAEDNKMLVEFLDSYAKFIATPKGALNYTRLSMTGLPRRTAGKKGGKAPKKKAISQRETVASEYRQPLSHTPVTSFSGSCTVPDVNVSTGGPSSVTVITSSSGGNFNSSGGNFNSSSYYQPYPAMYSPQGYFGASPFADISNYSPYYQYPVSWSTGPAYPSTPNSHKNSDEFVDSCGRFFVKFLNGRIKVCAGCRGPHLKSVDGALLPPPQDICIVHAEPLTFTNPRTGLEATKVGNAHYHANKACISRKHPHFSSRLLSCQKEVYERLTSVHLKFLFEALGYVPSAEDN